MKNSSGTQNLGFIINSYPRILRAYNLSQLCYCEEFLFHFLRPLPQSLVQPLW